MKNKYKFIDEQTLTYLIIIICAIIAFISIYGIRVLNPTYTDWLLQGGDLAQHYLGWQAYRNGDWHFPIGLTDTLAYPNYTSVIFTDSIPFFAVIFKFLSPILPNEFQYFGWWGIFCFIMQGILAGKIIKNYTNRKVIICLGSLFVILAPTMLWRMYVHTALAGQWILLIGIDILLTYKEKFMFNRKVYIYIGIMALFAASTHMYFVLMCGIILLGICLWDVLECKRIFRSGLMLMEYCIFALLTIALLLGGFSSAGAEMTGSGLGFYSLNLNALFNPQGWSCVLQDLATYTDGQYEGFGYIGLGGILLIFVAVIELLTNEEIKETVINNWKRILVVMFVILIICFVAVSPIASINSVKLYEIHLPQFVEKIWSVFRSSGRIVMVVSYIAMMVPVLFLLKRKPYRFVLVIVIISLGLQIYDLHIQLRSKHDYFANEIVYDQSLDEKEIWKELGENKEIKHVVVTYWAGDDFYKIGEWALKNRKTMNTFAMAHPDVNKLLEKVNILLENPDNTEIFIFDQNDQSFNLKKYPQLNFYTTDSYIIGYVGKISGVAPVDAENVKVWGFGNDEYFRDGENSDDGRILYPKGLSYGPYWKVEKGSYIATIYGTELSEKSDIIVYSSGGEKIHHFNIVNQDSEKIEMKIDLTESVSDLEFAITNISNDNLLLKKITLVSYKEEAE